MNRSEKVYAFMHKYVGIIFGKDRLVAAVLLVPCEA